MIFKTNISRNQNYKPTVYVYQEIYTCKKKTVTSVREATVNNLNMLNENVFPFFSISQNKEENVCETEVTIHRSLVVERPTGGLAKNPPFSCRVYSRQAHNPGQKSRGFLGPSLSIIYVAQARYQEMYSVLSAEHNKYSKRNLLFFFFKKQSAHYQKI